MTSIPVSDDRRHHGLAHRSSRHEPAEFVQVIRQSNIII